MLRSTFHCILDFKPRILHELKSTNLHIVFSIKFFANALQSSCIEPFLFQFDPYNKPPSFKGHRYEIEILKNLRFIIPGLV